MKQQEGNVLLRPRCRDEGIIIGDDQPGRLNAITDVEGVAVGHVTLHEGHGALVAGRGPVRTGVTVVLAHGGNCFRSKVVCACHVINGFGKATGLSQVTELGELETPIALTNTLSVGTVWDGLLDHVLDGNADIGVTTGTVNPVVGECNDGYLNDIRGRHVTRDHVAEALARAGTGAVAEGNVGAGTGMAALGHKGGIGTSSRVLPPEQGGHILGGLVLANFGRKKDLCIKGLPVGRLLRARGQDRPEDGSIVIVLATDAPLSHRQLARVAKRAAVGLARTGSYHGHGSGDYVVAFSTAQRLSHDTDELVRGVRCRDGSRTMDALFRAAAHVTEESIINALFAATTMQGRDGNTRDELPIRLVVELMREHGVIGQN